MQWIYLMIAGIFEVVWSVSMKLSEGFTIMKFTIITVLGMILSFAICISFLLVYVCRRLNSDNRC